MRRSPPAPGCADDAEGDIESALSQHVTPVAGDSQGITRERFPPLSSTAVDAPYGVAGK